MSAPRWDWSDGMFALHGMAPGDVVPTRALFLSHVHPEDRARVELLLHACVVDGQPVACEYRLVDLGGHTRNVMLVLSPLSSQDQTGGVSGVLIDDSQRLRRAVSEAVNTELQRALESHAVIDQAKGALMSVYGVDSETAFQLLRWASQQHNIRLRVLAETLIATLRSTGGLGPQVRAAMDGIFVAVLEHGQVPQQDSHVETVHHTFDLDAPVPTLQVTGRVDLVSMGDFAAAINQLVAAGRGRDGVVLDLRGAFLGTAAVFVLDAARRRSAAAGVTIRLLMADQPSTAHDERTTAVQAPRADRAIATVSTTH